MDYQGSPKLFLITQFKWPPCLLLLYFQLDFLLLCVYIYICYMLSHVQLFATPWTVCSPPVSSVHAIFQARILEWVAISYSTSVTYVYLNSALFMFWASLVAQMIKNLPAMHKSWVWSMCWEYPLEKHMATHSSILAWRIPMDRGAWQATVHGATQSDIAEQLTLSLCSIWLLPVEFETRELANVGYPFILWRDLCTE